MDFVDYAWDDIAGIFVKENILGSEFSFTTQSDLTISIDYLPKVQARKIYTYAKEQQDLIKEIFASPINATAFTEEKSADIQPDDAIEKPIEEVETEEVTDFADLIPIAQSGYRYEKQHPDPEPEEESEIVTEKPLAELSNEALFEKLQNYKKLLDNGLILQREYDDFKKEILSYM